MHSKIEGISFVVGGLACVVGGFVAFIWGQPPQSQPGDPRALIFIAGGFVVLVYAVRMLREETWGRRPSNRDQETQSLEWSDDEEHGPPKR